MKSLAEKLESLKGKTIESIIANYDSKNDAADPIIIYFNDGTTICLGSIVIKSENPQIEPSGRIIAIN